MSTVDTSTWNPDADLNTAIEGIPLNADAGIAQTWQALRILMAAVKGDGDAIKLTINQPDGTTIVATNQTLTVVDNGHAHTIANVAGLQTALDGKASSADMTGATASADGASGLVPAPQAGDQDKVLKGDGTWGEPETPSVSWSDVTGKPSTFTPSSHEHGSITNDGKLETASRAVVTDGSKVIGVSTVTAAELGYLSGATSAIQTQLDGKAASEHSHADYVDLTTDQYIDGTKTFIESVIMSHNSISAGFVVKQRGITRGGTWKNQKGTFVFRDNNDNALAEMQNYTYTNSNNVNFNQLLFILYKPESTSTSDTCGLLFDAGGWTSFIFSPNGSDDNKVYLGASNRRWKQLYAATATINTSDERCKDSITDIPDEVLDAWGDVRWRQFRFADAVAEKGDAARLHSGTVAQDVQRIFASAGLDVSRYGFFCYDRWGSEPEQLDENGRVVRDALEAGDRYSLRYEELLCIEAAYQRRRADRLEARIAEIEARLTAMEAANGY